MDRYEGSTLSPTTLHKYVYVANNPLNASDPTGRGVFENLFIRIGIFGQITVPGYVQEAVAAVGGTKGIIGIGTLLGFLAVELCEVFERGDEKLESAAQPPPTPVVTTWKPQIGHMRPPHSDMCPINFHDEWPGASEGSPLGQARRAGERE